MDYGELTIALLCNRPDRDFADPDREDRYYRELDPAWVGRMAAAWTAVVRQIAKGAALSRRSPPMTALKGHGR
jgi:hypothetical protein